MSQDVGGPVEVFYLATEPFRNGYRWIVRQYGKSAPVQTGTDLFETQNAARKAGRSNLIAVSARAKPTRVTRRKEVSAEASDWIG